MTTNKRPARKTQAEVDAILGMMTDGIRATVSPPQQPRQESHAGWTWEDGNDPYLQPGH